MNDIAPTESRDRAGLLVAPRGGDTRCGATLIKRLALSRPDGITTKDVADLKLRHNGPTFLTVLYKRGYVTRSGTRGAYRYHAIPERCRE